MDIQPEETTQPISDDQELAKVLAGVSQFNDALAVEEAPAPEPAAPVIPGPGVVQPFNGPMQTQDQGDDLESIKRDAISELRPLVDKLNLPPEEKFDTYLLLIRSTDDTTLIAPAHEAARNIVDESRRAQALLDIIKEIDFLSNQALNA